jgi:hypothetical protein
VAEVLAQFTDPVISEDDVAYLARACGTPAPDGLWQGWIEFEPLERGEPLRTGRETTQPNRQDALYWAGGLTHVYLEGALRRALHPLVRTLEPEPPVAAFDGPAPDVLTAPAVESVLNPFSVYRKGEAHLRSQLSALSAWHLVNITRAYNLTDLDSEALNALDQRTLVELIVVGVRAEEAVRSVR